jgi:hypothetical protein
MLQEQCVETWNLQCWPGRDRLKIYNVWFVVGDFPQSPLRTTVTILDANIAKERSNTKHKLSIIFPGNLG